MKQEITGYITGIINNHNRIIEDLVQKKCGYSDMRLVEQRSRTNELSDLLDFAQDIPEEKHEPVIINNSTDLEKIKSYARKLEKINTELRLDNIAWQKACNELKLKNEYQEESLKTYEANRQAFADMAAKYKEWEETNK